MSEDKKISGEGSACYQTAFYREIAVVVRSVVEKEYGLERPWKPEVVYLKPGMILEGTCKCDSSKKDMFVVLDYSNIEDCFLLRCITQEIGWSYRWIKGYNNVSKKSTAQTLSDDSLPPSLGSEFREYNYKIIYASDE